MTVLITGAGGFIGFHLARALLHRGVTVAEPSVATAPPHWVDELDVNSLSDSMTSPVADTAPPLTPVSSVLRFPRKTLEVADTVPSTRIAPPSLNDVLLVNEVLVATTVPGAAT